MPGLLSRLAGARAAPAVIAVEPAARVEAPADADVSDPHTFTRRVPGIEARPREGVAVLMVQRHGDGAFTMTGACGAESLAETRCNRPRLGLGELARPGGRSATEIHYLLREWSRTVAGLADWIRRIRARHPDDALRLVVWDGTGFEIPWELFHVGGAPGHDGGWLGALVPVARKLTIHDGVEGWDPWAAEHVCVGAAVASVDEEMSPDLDALSAWVDRNVAQADLLDELDRFGGPLGMLYIACHGEYDDADIFKLRLGTFGLRDIDGRAVTAVAAGHSLVFLNACHAGSLTWSDLINNGAFGFAEVFLRKGAAAVVGVSGAVGTHRATQVARELVGALGAAEETPIAVALRDVRRRVAERAEAGLAEDALREFFYTFMYVLWGSPFAVLRLQRAAS